MTVFQATKTKDPSGATRFGRLFLLELSGDRIHAMNSDQEGRYVGRLIAKELKGRKVERPFRYFDKGNMAVVGKNYAVLERGWLRTSGFLTWLVWAFVHILSLPQLQNRLRVQRQWLWTYFTGQRSSRLIPEPPLDDR